MLFKDRAACCWTLAVLLGLTLAGCGSKGPALAPAGGTVTYKAQPVEGAQIMFFPANGKPATATTDAQGHFKLNSLGQDGAIVGHHSVTIAKVEPVSSEPYAAARQLLPKHYGQTTSSGLSADVTAAGPNDFKFDLVDKP